jgi:hypothetical protein
MNGHGYVFVLTPIDLVCPEGVEVAPSHRLVRANEEQTQKIKQVLEQFNTNPFFFPTPYENTIRSVPGERPGEVRYPRSALPRENWRYWIIEFDGTNSELQELGFACSLIPNDIELGFHVIFHETFNGPSLGWDPAALSTYFNHGFEYLLTKPINQQNLNQIRRNFDDIKNLPPEYPHIRRALIRFDQLRWLPRRSEMVVIGLFSVIESLVSHAPKLTDSADSLSHQIRTKLPLLRKRFADPLDHFSQFPSIEEENLWKKLYAYRSKIVHGEDSQLSGDLTSLKQVESVIAFLRETSKRLIHLSLREPQFMTDLKKC